MNVIVDVCIIPMGAGLSVSPYVAMCQSIFRDAGLPHQLHAWGTNVEGPWEDVMGAIRQCHEKLHEEGIVRISTTIKLGTRTDRHQTMHDKIDSVQKKL